MEFGQISTPMMNQAGNQMPGGNQMNQMQGGNQMQGNQMQGNQMQGNQMQSGNQIPVPVQQMQESIQHQVSIHPKILFENCKIQYS